MAMDTRKPRALPRQASWWQQAVTRQRAAATRLANERRLARRNQFLGGLASIGLALDWLERHGLDVLNYENGAYHQPSIHIQTGPACAVLKAEHDGRDFRTSTSGEPKRWWRANLLGCYVEWAEEMH